MLYPFRLEEHIRAATEAANVALWSICPETGETWFSDTWYTMLGYAPGAFEASFDAFLERMNPADRDATTHAYLDLIEGRTETYAADFRLLDAEDNWRWIGATGSKVERSDGLPYVVYGIQLDITARKETETKLTKEAQNAHEHRQKLSRLEANSPVALFEFRIEADESVSLPYMTSGVHEILGVPSGDIEEDGLNVFRNIFEEDAAKMNVAIEESMKNLSVFRMRYRVHRPDMPGGFIWVQVHSVPMREGDGSTVWFGSIYDVTAEVEREALLADARDSMRQLALHDSLTGLPNRRTLDDALTKRAQQNASKGEPQAVIVRVDLDRFKFVNDTLGHAAGDAVLKHIAGILLEVCDPSDLACRTGGDEFCVLMAPRKTLGEAERLVARVQDCLKISYKFEGKPCRFGASFGIASSDQGAIASGDLMSYADAALYEAKAAGRNRLVVFDNALHDTLRDSRYLANEIEVALENKEFEPFFQPQIDAATGGLVGAEVLARWRLASGEVVPPDRFMPVAEQIRAVHLIDSMMVEKAGLAIAEWMSDGFRLPKISFNVSAGRLRDPSLVSAVKGIQKFGVSVAFELLESILLEEEDGVAEFNLDTARDAGIDVEIDDFGTGHASILGLMRVRPDALKIDRRLTADVTQSGQARVLLSSIVAIAQSMEIRTIAEGVETAEQEDVLRELGCDTFQGYYYSRPLNAEGFMHWVSLYPKAVQQASARFAS